MKKHLRLILATFCLGVLLFAGFILAVNLYVQSSGVQARIQTALTRAVGVPVGLYRTTFSPWGGFRLDQVKIGPLVPGRAPDFLLSHFLEVRCDVLPLLEGRVVIRRIALDAPVFTLQQNSSGQFELPRRSAAPASPLTGTPAPAAPSTTTPTTTVRPEIRKLLLRNGTFRFLAADGRELLRFEEVRCSLNAQDAPGVYAGDLQISKAVFHNRLTIVDIASVIGLERQKWQIENLHGEIAGGQVDATLRGDMAAAGQPYGVRLRYGKGRLPELFPKDSELSSEVEGVVHARLEYDGFFSEPARNTGHAEVKISRAKISGLPFFQMLGQLTRADEFARLNIRKTEIKADFAGAQTHFISSYVQADRVQVLFAGLLDENHRLDLQAQLLVADSLFKKLPTEARENFVPQDGQQVLDFVITGPITEPETNFVHRLIGEKLQRKLKNILGLPGSSSSK